jgi:hypothetical protein
LSAGLSPETADSVEMPRGVRLRVAQEHAGRKPMVGQIRFELRVLAYPPAEFAGLIVLRLANQAHVTVENAIRRVLELVSREPVAGTLWIIQERRVRIHGSP